MAGRRGSVVLAHERGSSSTGRKSRTPTRKSCEIFSGYARSVEANGGASTSSQRTRPIRLGKNIAQTPRRSQHWRLSELPALRQVRWYENRLASSQSSSSRSLQFCYVQ